MKVIIVEDEKIIRKKLEILPSYSKYSMEVVASGKNGLEGLALIKEFEPEVVITDITMPLMDGLKMIEESMEYDYSAIIISGYDDFSYAKKAIRYGVTDYLLKPIDIEELNEALVNAKMIYEIKRGFLSGNKFDILKEDNKADLQDETCLEMIKYIEENYRDKISITDLEGSLHYSESMLNKKFKESSSMTFNDYLNRYRITRAMEFLRDEDLAISDIAFRCGFSNQKYFSKVFKKYLGLSPSDYRKSLKL